MLWLSGIWFGSSLLGFAKLASRDFRKEEGKLNKKNIRNFIFSHRQRKPEVAIHMEPEEMVNFKNKLKGKKNNI